MIITDEEALRIDCEPVLSDEVDDLRKKLEEGLAWSEKQGRPGVGLACPQIGIAKSMAIVRVNDRTRVDLVNAKIVEKSDLVKFHGEGCLSYPDRFETTMRYQEIVVENNLVWPHRFVATGFVAVVVQHEMDHLKGVLLPDVAVEK